MFQDSREIEVVRCSVPPLLLVGSFPIELSLNDGYDFTSDSVRLKFIGDAVQLLETAVSGVEELQVIPTVKVSLCACAKGWKGEEGGGQSEGGVRPCFS